MPRAPCHFRRSILHLPPRTRGGPRPCEQAEAIEEDLREETTDLDPLRPATTSVRSQIEAIMDDIDEELERGIPLGRDHEFA